MIKRYKFPDEATGWFELNEAGYMLQDYETNEKGEEVPVGGPYLPHGNKGQGFDIIVLGAISKPTGEVNEEGDPIMKQLVGWHVDILTSSVPENLEAYLIEPQNPVHCV